MNEEEGEEERMCASDTGLHWRFLDSERGDSRRSPPSRNVATHLPIVPRDDVYPRELDYGTMVISSF